MEAWVCPYWVPLGFMSQIAQARCAASHPRDYLRFRNMSRQTPPRGCRARDGIPLSTRSHDMFLHPFQCNYHGRSQGRAGWAAGPVSMPMSLAGNSACLTWTGWAGCAGEEVGPLSTKLRLTSSVVSPKLVCYLSRVQVCAKIAFAIM